MTINYLFEVLASLYAVLIGKPVDSTMMQGFNDSDKEPYEQVYDYL